MKGEAEAKSEDDGHQPASCLLSSTAASITGCTGSVWIANGP